MSTRPPEIVLVRHGETEWSRSGKHTGRTDLPLTEKGRQDSIALGEALSGREFALVLTSPLARAAETCRLAGFGDVAEERDDLMEWDYGDYEGHTTPEIREERPGWTLWKDGVPGGETAAEVGARTDRVIAELRSVDGDAAVFGHGHLLRVLAARWLGLEPTDGRLFALDPATINILGNERETPVVRLWNSSPRGVALPDAVAGGGGAVAGLPGAGRRRGATSPSVPRRLLLGITTGAVEAAAHIKLARANLNRFFSGIQH